MHRTEKSTDSTLAHTIWRHTLLNRVVGTAREGCLASRPDGAGGDEHGGRNRSRRALIKMMASLQEPREIHKQGIMVDEILAVRGCQYYG
jgi:hypothetical protein